MELKKPKQTLVLHSWEFGLVLGALSKPPYEWLAQASLSLVSRQSSFSILIWQRQSCFFLKIVLAESLSLKVISYFIVLQKILTI